MNYTNTSPAAAIAAEECYVVVHPCFDAPEAKRDIDSLGPMKLSRSGKVALFGLRAYLVLMMGMVAYRALDMAGVITHLKG